MDLVSRVVEKLRTAPDFSAGADALLTAVIERVQESIRDQSCSMRILRVMLHLRPGGSYQDLVVKSPPGAQEAERSDGQWLLPSATVWRHVVEHEQALSVALMMGSIQLMESGRRLHWRLQRRDGDKDASIVRLLDRDATHLYVLPLRIPGGGIQGMISAEMCTRDLMASPDWSRHAAALQLLADVSAPALVLLPRAAERPAWDDPLLPVVGSSMADTVRLLGVFATMEETLLVSGPTGAGKSRLARWCHERSHRSEGPFETADLQTIPEQTQMAELFGWRRGAFTGAVSDQEGYVARAAGGTLFIDEIDKLSLKAQAGLLQLLETRSFRPMGSSGGPVPADLRFVVGTNADLPAAIREGSFREDLYYRINVLPVRLPPLAERKDEIPGWAAFMLDRRHRELGQQGRAVISDDAVALLCEPAWPGNLRQLDNSIRRAYAISMAACRPGRELCIEASHVAQALSFEGELGAAAAAPPPLMGALDQLAERFVRLAEDLRAQGRHLDLQHTDALRGGVLRQALASSGDLKEVYRLFGRQSVVASRNHQRDYRRELDRLQRLQQLCQTSLRAGRNESGGS